jgi:hypothetical protein
MRDLMQEHLFKGCNNIDGRETRLEEYGFRTGDDLVKEGLVISCLKNSLVGFPESIIHEPGAYLDLAKRFESIGICDVGVATRFVGDVEVHVGVCEYRVLVYQQIHEAMVSSAGVSHQSPSEPLKPRWPVPLLPLAHA